MKADTPPTNPATRALAPTWSTRKVGSKAIVPTEKLAQQPKPSVSAQMRRLGNTRRRLSPPGDGTNAMRLENKAIAPAITAHAKVAARQDSRSATRPEPMAPSANPTGTKLLHKASATVRHALTHTAGISYGNEPHIAATYREKGLGPAAGNGWYTADKDEPVCVTMERLGTLPFVSQPGEKYVYGYNIDILGCVVEKVSGQGLDVFIKSRILDPLGMKDTSLGPRADLMKRLCPVKVSYTDLPALLPPGVRSPS